MNCRPLEPHSSALAKLSHAPDCTIKTCLKSWLIIPAFSIAVKKDFLEIILSRRYNYGMNKRQLVIALTALSFCSFASPASAKTVNKTKTRKRSVHHRTNSAHRSGALRSSFNLYKNEGEFTRTSLNMHKNQGQFTKTSLDLYKNRGEFTRPSFNLYKNRGEFTRSSFNLYKDQGQFTRTSFNLYKNRGEFTKTSFSVR